MRSWVSVLLFFGVLIVLRTVHMQMSGNTEKFLNQAELLYTKRDQQQQQQEGFRGGGGEAIGGRTAGPSNEGDSEELFTPMTEQDKKQKEMIQEAFTTLGPSSGSPVVGKSEIDSLDGPADAELNQPRKPYNLLDHLPAAPRGSPSCLTASCCSETDFESRTTMTGNYLQRTNNYKREFPDSCSAPLTELNLAFYKNSVLQKTA